LRLTVRCLHHKQDPAAAAHAAQRVGGGAVPPSIRQEIEHEISSVLIQRDSALLSMLAGTREELPRLNAEIAALREDLRREFGALHAALATVQRSESELRLLIHEQRDTATVRQEVAALRQEVGELRQTLAATGGSSRPHGGSWWQRLLGGPPRRGRTAPDSTGRR
jgi:hypothetical protein